MLIGALAMAAHGYVRETSDIDVRIAIADDADLDRIEESAHALGLRTKARHSFGGFDFRTPGEHRIDVVSLRDELAPLVKEAINEAVASGRKTSLPGTEGERAFFVASVGHVIALKLIASRRKDIGDIVELIKMLMSTGAWPTARPEIHGIVRRHLGWYAASVTLQRFTDDATAEMQP